MLMISLELALSRAILFTSEAQNFTRQQSVVEISLFTSHFDGRMDC